MATLKVPAGGSASVTAELVRSVDPRLALRRLPPALAGLDRLTGAVEKRVIRNLAGGIGFPAATDLSTSPTTGRTSPPAC